MKTLVVIVIATFLLSASAYSQNLAVGPLKGIGISTVHITDNAAGGLDKKFFPSFVIGGKFVYSFVSDWGISAVVNLSREGGRLKGTLGGSNEYDYTYDAYYIRVPMQGIYFFGKLGDIVRPKVAAGPSFGFLVGGKSDFKVNEQGPDKVSTTDILEPFDIGIISSVGLNVQIIRNRDIWINSDLSYYHGLTNASSSGPGNFSNRNLQMTMGIMFPLGTIKPR
jgi:hypothetical protein